MNVRNEALKQNLHADAPTSDRAKRMMLYGQFLGSWDGTLKYLDPEGKRRETTAEVHFGWVLEGRAVQDVWIAPSRKNRKEGERLLMHGSTFRVYDPQNDNWQITWIDPVKQVVNRMTGRQVGEEIVQEYRMDDGKRCQWMFTDITADSFHWINRVSADDGKNWDIRGEFFLRRRKDWIFTVTKLSFSPRRHEEHEGARRGTKKNKRRSRGRSRHLVN